MGSSSGVRSTPVTCAPAAAAASAAFPVPQARSATTAPSSGRNRSTISTSWVAMGAMRCATASYRPADQMDTSPAYVTSGILQQRKHGRGHRVDVGVELVVLVDELLHERADRDDAQAGVGGLGERGLDQFR